MTLSSIIALLRDLSAILAAASAVGAALLLWSGAGASAGLAAGAACAALGGALGVSVIGALGLGGASPLTTALVVGGLCLAAAALGAHLSGARGLWLAVLGAGGVGLGVLISLAFARAGLMGPAGPLVALSACALLAAGALSASLVSANRLEARAGAPAAADLAVATAPPVWFEALYVQLSGGAPGARPPDLIASVSQGRSKPPGDGARADQTARAPAPGAPDAGDPLTPPPLETPPAAIFGAPLVGAHHGAPVLQKAPSPPPAPRASQVGPSALAADTGLRTPVAEGAFAQRPAQAEPPVAAAAPGLSRTAGPAPVAPDPLQRVAPPPDAPRLGKAPSPPSSPGPAAVMARMNERSIAPAAAAAPGQTRAQPTLARIARLDPAPAPPRAPTERLRTQYVCFPLLGAQADRFCAARRGVDGRPQVQPSEVDVLWRGPDGAARGAVDDVSCFIDRGLANHVTLVVALPANPDAASAGDADQALTKGDVFYAAVAQLIGSARAQDDAHRLQVSAFFANGARLAGPWASHDFGAERADRLFDLQSSGQTLDLLRRMKHETQTPRRAADAAALSTAVVQASADRPRPSARPGQSLLVALVDGTLAVEPGEQHIEAMARAAHAADAPLFIVALTDGAPVAPGLEAAAEATGGLAYGAASLEELNAAIERVMLRAQGYCAVRVSAPPQLLSSGALELKVRRRLGDRCRFVQTARLNCGSAEIDSLFEPSEGAQAHD